MYHSAPSAAGRFRCEAVALKAAPEQQQLLLTAACDPITCFSAALAHLLDTL